MLASPDNLDQFRSVRPLIFRNEKVPHADLMVEPLYRLEAVRCDAVVRCERIAGSK